MYPFTVFPIESSRRFRVAKANLFTSMTPKSCSKYRYVKSLKYTKANGRIIFMGFRERSNLTKAVKQCP